MSNIMIGIKRFFQNKNTVTIFAIVLSVVVLYVAYSMRIKKATEPKSVPYATVDIQPRTEITEDMVGVRAVPGSVITSNVITDMDSVVGKYVSNEALIPADSLFYNGTIVAWEDLPKTAYGDIRSGNQIFYLPVNMDSTYGNSIFPGNYIDLYYNGYVDNKILIAKFIESIEVKAVVDGNYDNVFEKSSSETEPAYILFELPEDWRLLLDKTIYLDPESLIPVPRNAQYSEKGGETRIVSAYIKNLVESRTVNVTEDDLRRVVNNRNNTNTTNGGAN